MEVAGLEVRTTNEPQPDVPDFISVLPLTFSRVVSMSFSDV